MTITPIKLFNNNPDRILKKNLGKKTHLLQQQTIPHTNVAAATTIIKDAIVT